MGSLIAVDDGPPAVRCKLCGKVAVGPCARCRASVCGDCCELTEGGATIFAICLACVKRGGKSLARPWLGLVAWLGAIILGLIAIAAALMLAGCDGGKLVATGGTGASAKLALRDGYAYWADLLQGITRAPVGGGPVQRLTQLGGGDGNVALNATHLFWRADGEVRRIPHAGGDLEIVGATVPGIAFRLAVDDAALYYARGETLLRRALADGTESPLAADRRSTSLALAGDTLIGTTCAGAETADAVWAMPADGAAPPRPLRAGGCPEAAAVDDAFVYFFDGDGIFRLPRAGGTAVRLLDAASNVFAVREGLLYATDRQGRVVEVPIAGGDPTVLVDEPVDGLAADATHLYYTQRAGIASLALLRLPLP